MIHGKLAISSWESEQPSMAKHTHQVGREAQVCGREVRGQGPQRYGSEKRGNGWREDRTTKVDSRERRHQEDYYRARSPSHLPASEEAKQLGQVQAKFR